VSTTNTLTSLEPEEMALHWLVHYDMDLNLLPDTPINRFRLQQRYALAILSVQQDDTNPFVSSVDPECEWDGVTCQSMYLGNELGIQDAVTKIFFDTYNNGNMWTGQLRADLGLLSTLTHFNMSGDSVRFNTGGLFGALPSQIGQWTNLQNFDVSENVLTGSLPSQIGQWTNLKYMYVYSNFLTGSLPTQIGQLTHLQELFVSGNNFIGTMPVSICLLRNLNLTGLAADCVSEISCNENCCTYCA
jgi:Leucine-rich repeat (LRR) protein